MTGRVGVEGVADAFAELANPDAHAKILVEPTGDAATRSSPEG